MKKTKPISIFLLKKDFNAISPIKSDYVKKLIDNPLSTGEKFYLLKSSNNEPWWKNYLGLQDSLSQGLNCGLLLINAAEKSFAICFGNIAYVLDENLYEHDFGWKTTLNLLDNKIKATEYTDTNSLSKNRTQYPSILEWTQMDIDKNTDIIQRIEGKVESKYKDLVSSACGTASLRVQMKKDFAELPDLCAELYKIYQKDDYRRKFPNIDNIRQVTDPDILKQLNDSLLNALKEKDQNVFLTFPKMLKDTSEVFFKYKLNRKSERYDDLDIADFYTLLSEDLRKLEKKDFQKFAIILCNENEDVIDSASLKKCLIFDTKLQGKTYIFNEGIWYHANDDYIACISQELDALFKNNTFISFDNTCVENGKLSEGAYNGKVGQSGQGYVCLDRTNIAPNGQGNVEPCDLFSIDSSGQPTFIHVKRSTHSSILSHLFNQGLASVDLLRSVPESFNKLEKLATEKLGNAVVINNGLIHVIFAIITNKDASKKSTNLPLFSRLTLYRVYRELVRHNCDVNITYILDNSTSQNQTVAA